MSTKPTLKCAKCGITSKEDLSLIFHRFPLPSKRDGNLKARVWATYCFPDEEWTTIKLQSLHTQHKMLCSKHFDHTSYISSDKKRLNKFAIPVDAKDILIQLRRDEKPVAPTVAITEDDQNLVSAASPQLNMMNTVTLQKSEEVKHSETLDDELASSSLMNIDVEVTASTSHISQELHQKTPKRKGILKELDAKTLIELTPKKQKLYKRCRRNLSEIMRLRQKLRKVKICNRSILSSLASNDPVNEMIESKLSSSFYCLLQSQLRNTSRKLKGRRWSLNDKILALSIFKKSSACYRLLSRLFCLPSVTSLKSLLNKVPMVCGINDQVLNTIKEITAAKNINDNLCVVAFDEMSIRKNLSYNTKLDQIDGFQDHAGQGRTAEIATQALTFMAIGVRKHWKQPIAFFFSGAHLSSDRLAVLIKEVLSACFGAGLKVVGIVCDCDGANIRAINILGSSSEQPYFIHEGHEIVTILDPPHLLKSFRNNFMKYNIEFMQDVQIGGNQIKGTAKWNHIEEFFKQDKQNPNFVFAPALTEQHIQPNGKQKMKVRLAAQVLSHSVAAGLFAKISQNELPQEAIATAGLIANIDKLFDAMNGDTPTPKRGKLFLRNISENTPHMELFQKMKCFFKEMTFLGARSKPPSQEGWVRTINAIERLLKNLKKYYQVNTLSGKRLNQDPLENCFGCVRSNCGCNPNPTSVQFVAALKTSMLTNLINNNKSRNCLDDKNNLLNDMTTFLTQENKTNEEGSANTVLSVSPPTPYNYFEELETISVDNVLQCSGELQACSYVCGFILNNSATNCENCKKIMLVDPNTEAHHLFTSFKEFNDEKSRLKYVTGSFVEMVESTATLINNYLSQNAHKRNLKKNLCKLCEVIKTDWLKGCEEHHQFNSKNILNSTMALCLKRYCTVKNRDFVEEASKKQLKRKINIIKHV